MNQLIKAAGVVTLLGLSAIPALAQDVTTATCGDYMAADDGTRLQWIGAIKVYASDAANAASTAELQASLLNKTDGDLDQRVQMGCDGKDVNQNILDLLKMN